MTTESRNDTVPALSQRLQRLRERALERGNRTGGVPGERALAMMTAWRICPGCSWVQHRALTILELVRNASFCLDPDADLVGEHLFSNETVALDWGRWGEAARVQLKATPMSAERKSELADFMKQYTAWRGAPVWAVGVPDPEMEKGRGEWGREAVFMARGWMENHSVRDFAKVVRIGFLGIREEIEAAMAGMDVTDPRYPECSNFWRAALSICEAGMELGRRHAELARARAASTTDPEVRRRCLATATVCERVPARGARTLREATQAVWFAHILTCAEDQINANSIGRLDQILQPYYEQDIRENHLSPQDALELMAELGCKLYLDYDVQQICLGGLTDKGADAANEMTYLILEATRALDFIRCISVRLHRHSPGRLLRTAAEMVRGGGGIPFFFNDHAIVRALTDRGIKLEDARSYAPIGCVEITIPGKANPHAVSGWLNAAKCLELALFDGMDPGTGEQLGPQTGAFTECETFQDLLEAYKQQIEHFARSVVYCCNRGELMQRERGPMPCWSTMTDCCIARGRDITDGGALYNYHSVAFLGIANVADSLAAIERLVFESGRVSREQLLGALRSNFEDCEPLRRMLIAEAPKYGNDAREVDEFAAEVCRHFCTYMDRFRSPLGGRYFVHLFSFRLNVTFGKATGALPDGRRAGEPLAYSLSPHQGRDQEGVTALLQSLGRIPHDLAAGSSAAIVELDPKLVEDESGLDRMVSVLRTSIELGVGQLQFNVVTAERLVRALDDPEHYGNIQVRVAGYSSRFRLLDEDLQKHIIARTKHER